MRLIFLTIRHTLLGIFLLMATTVFAQPSSFEDISKAINNRDGSLLGVQMGNIITISIGNKSNIYSRAQSILVLKDYFERQKISKFKILQTGSKNQSLFGIGSMKAKDKTLMVYLYLEYDKTSDKYLLRELKFEE